MYDSHNELRSISLHLVQSANVMCTCLNVAFFDSPLHCLATNSRDSIASNLAVIVVVILVEVVDDFCQAPTERIGRLSPFIPRFEQCLNR